MAVYKDKWNGYDGKTWRVTCSYKDWKGNARKHDKRGFATKREAMAYEHEFMLKTRKDIRMGFSDFLDVYMSDLAPQIKQSTLALKRNIIEKHIKPYFQNKSLSEISPTDILLWQNELLAKRDTNGKGYSPTFLRSINNQLSAAFNHAVRYYGLPQNPCHRSKKIGRSKAREMLFWTQDEYMLFSEAMKSKPVSYYAFQMLYWTGIRCGELLALTVADFNFEKKTVSINKTYQVLQGKEIISSPKTEKSNRVVSMPDFLANEMQDYIASLYKIKENQRIFEISKSYLHHEMDRGSREAGVKRIRIHDLRHSSCALLIELGYAPIQIAERLGHESATITERYSHLYPSVQQQMASKLDEAYQQKDKECHYD